jgi:hypothetical protein
MRARGTVAILAALTALWPAFAHASEPPALSVQGVAVGAGPADGWLVQPAAALKPGEWLGSAALHYARTPLRFSATGGLQQTVIGDLGMVDAAALVGLPKHWAVGAVLPVAWLMRGGGPNVAQLSRLPQGPALGDVQIQLRKQFWQGPALGGESTFSFDLAGELPTSAAGNWLGGAGAAVLRGWWSLTTGPWRGDLGVGARLTPTQSLRVAPLDANGQPDASQMRDALRAGSTADVAMALRRSLGGGDVRVGAELAAHLPLVTTVAENLGVVELAASGDYALNPWLRLGAVIGAAPTTGPGSAALRLGAVLRFDPQALPSDRDGDGLDDRLDRCPDAAEDRDGFEDRDGCPDTDDDGDAVPDASDKCRLVAEDRDGFQDDDGCPDTDDDGDAIVDAKDLCPRAAEDRDGFQDDDGCPDTDDDGDGIADSADLCPQQAETKNGYEDQDGCPDMKPGEAPPAIEPPQGATPAAEEPAPVAAPVEKPKKGAKKAKGPAAAPTPKAEPKPAPSGEAKPVEAPKAAEAKAAEAKPAEAKPAEAKPAEAKPAEGKPADAPKAAETKPAAKAESKPKAETKPNADTKPAEPEGKPRVKVKDLSKENP